MIRPVILCGGAGTRLWPLSRQLFPKQLLPLIGEQSLLQQTATRLSDDDFAPAVVVSGEDQRFFIRRQLEESKTPLAAILLEPTPRNTSAAAALAASWLESLGRKNEVMLLMPSDHVILNRTAFLEAIKIGLPHAETGAIITFGAQPTEPNTQYGYIEADVAQPTGDGAFPIARFVEKPAADKAAEYLASGRFYWNAGIFLLKASTLLDEMRRFLPESLDAIATGIANATTEGVFVRPPAQQFERAANISIDHGIMEKTSHGMVVPVQMDWSDVGSWDAVWKLGSKDPDGNVRQGDVIALDTHSSLLRSEAGGPLIAAVGVHEMVVIALRDAVLVAPIKRVSDVKSIVESLKADSRDCVVNPLKMGHPWGSHEWVANGPRLKVGHIFVNIGEEMPLQTRSKCFEHWVVVRGFAEVTVGDQVSTMEESESVYIRPETPYGFRNAGGEVSLELVQIQFIPDPSEDPCGSPEER
jgi:mannose-1-phosphate guanylyltransferase/mannose-6-phosphate isomerase